MSSPALLDAALDAINGKLSTSLSWLSNTYGKCERLVGEGADGRPYYEPAVFVGGRVGKDYLRLWPDATLGNFCFWDVPGPQEIDENVRSWPQVTTTAGLIIWGDFRTVFPAGADQTNSLENIKKQVWEALTRRGVAGVKIKPLRFWERADQIYLNYSHQEIDHQFLMRPYFGLRVDCILKITQPC